MKSVMVNQLFLLYVMCHSVLQFTVMMVAQPTTDNGQHQLAEPAKQPQQHPKVYTNQFVLQIEGGPEEAREIASKHGFVYLDHIFGDYHHLQHRRIAKRSITSDSIAKMNISIEEEPQVISLRQQVLKRRVKRDLVDLGPAPRSHHAGNPASQNHSQSQFARVLHPMGISRRPLLEPMSSEVAYSAAAAADSAGGANNGAGQHVMIGGDLDLSASSSNSNPVPSPLPPSPLYNLNRGGSSNNNNNNSPTVSNLSGNNGHEINVTGSTFGRPASATAALSSAGFGSATPQFQFNDPSWSQMWYLDRGAKNGFDLNVMAAWNMGYTGKGIVITILDDGLEKDHPDLQANYDPKASFDINGDDSDPMPRYDMADSNRHGTRCAGEVAAVSENNICSVGIAFNSKVGGVRMLDGDVTDAVEARSLSLNQQHIHIYSASWGPDDNGKTVDGPGELATHAFIEGVTNGRQGLGSIFVFASGNGGREFDNCNCDGYTNSIWTLSISSATENGLVPWYSEACSSTLATTYSSGSYDERQIITTDLHHSCTSSHTGTSASAPLAAGICALVLEANPKLTWRDMQHIVVRTAKPANLIAKDWRTNSLGRNVSHSFGYGLMDAAAMIHLAKRWNTVPIQYTCEVRSPTMDKAIPSKGYIELKLQAACNNIHHLEHVQSKITLSSARRGDLHIYLVSPHGTRSTLLAQRPHDTAKQGFRNWPFMTVHSWGEHPNGEWTLEVHNEGKQMNRAHLKEWTLILYGTDVDVNSSVEQHNNKPAQATSAPTRLPKPAQSGQFSSHRPAAAAGANNQQPQQPNLVAPTSVPTFSLPANVNNVPTTPTTTLNPVTNFPTIEPVTAPTPAQPAHQQQQTAGHHQQQQQPQPQSHQPTSGLHDQPLRPTSLNRTGSGLQQPSPNTDRYAPKPHHHHNNNNNLNNQNNHHHNHQTNQHQQQYSSPAPPQQTVPPAQSGPSQPKIITPISSTAAVDLYGSNNNSLPGKTFGQQQQQQQHNNQNNEFIIHDYNNNRQMAVPKPPVDPGTVLTDDNKIDIIKPSIHQQTTSANANSEKATTTPPIVMDEFGSNGLDNNQITGSTTATKDYRSSGNNQLVDSNSCSPLAAPSIFVMITLTALAHLTASLVLAPRPRTHHYSLSSVK